MTADNGPFGWTHDVTEVGERGLARTREASAAEREELCRELDLVSCDSLSVEYRITSLAGGRYRMTGVLRAALTQACVVTLEPLPETLAEPFDIELRPAGDDMDEPDDTGSEGDEHAILSQPDIEPIENGRIELGRIAYEIVASALDPYPRKQGVEFDWTDPKATGGSDVEKPFAALAKLKKST